MDGIEVDKLRLGPFLWLGLGKNFLEKIELLNVNLEASSDEKKKKKVNGCKKQLKRIKGIKEVYIYYMTGMYIGRI